MGQGRNDEPVSLLPGRFVKHDGQVRFQPKGKGLLNVLSDWYEGATFQSNVGRQVVVLGAITAQNEVAIRAIFGLVEPTARAKPAKRSADRATDNDMSVYYTWMY